MKVLDAGCGLKPRGDVNVDLYIDSTHRRSGKGPKLNPDGIQNFIQADIRDLSIFRDKQFPIVRCHQTLEHVAEWRQALRELWRVCGYHLIVEVPDRRYLGFPQLKRSKHHISNFDAQTLEQAVPGVLGTRCFEVSVRYRGLFHKLIPFPLWPEMVRLDVWRV